MKYSPTQLIPAFNWLASFSTRKENGLGEFTIIQTEFPIVCWALGILDNGKTEIHGMIPDKHGNIVSAKLEPGFTGYAMFGETDEESYELEAITDDEPEGLN